MEDLTLQIVSSRGTNIFVDVAKPFEDNDVAKTYLLQSAQFFLWPYYAFKTLGSYLGIINCFERKQIYQIELKDNPLVLAVSIT
jgi:hypothetical protein